MAMHEFRMTEALAEKHTWTATSRRRYVECRCCKALAQIIHGVHYEAYPATSGSDCATVQAPLVSSPLPSFEAQRVRSRARVRPGLDEVQVEKGPALEAEVRGVQLRFPRGIDPTFVAAVVRAINTWQPPSQ